MASIIFHTRRPNTHENLVYVLDFHVSDDVHFSHFEEMKERFSHLSISIHELCTKSFRVFGGQ